jgi:hypothetical protein
MAKLKNPNIANEGKKFSKDYQPSPEAKSKGRKRINGFKDALEFFGTQLKEMKTLEDGTEVDLSFEANIGYQLMKKANEGDLKAIEIMAKLNGWEAPKKTENINTTIEIIRKNADSIE